MCVKVVRRELQALFDEEELVTSSVIWTSRILFQSFCARQKMKVLIILYYRCGGWVSLCSAMTLQMSTNCVLRLSCL